MVYLFRFVTIALLVYVLYQALCGVPEMPASQLASFDDATQFALLTCMVGGSALVYSSID